MHDDKPDPPFVSNQHLIYVYGLISPHLTRFGTDKAANQADQQSQIR